jgi:ribonuclease BN (tRNA processing enzyme)
VVSDGGSADGGGPLRITVLGCAGSYPGVGTACSGYLLRHGGTTVVLDLGPGTLSVLQEHVALKDIDGVVLSHGHADHWTDLAVLRTAWKYALGREGLAVYGTSDTRAKAEVVSESGTDPTFDWHVLDEDVVAEIGSLRFTFRRTEHYVETFAARVEAAGGGPAIAYSADTGPGWSFASFGAPIAIALCEASHLADREGDGVLHLSARQAGAMCRAAGVGRVVLTHLVPGSDPDAARREAATAFGADVEIASPHATYEV